jgi:ABC-2 type transport system ATP-binding protein
MMMSDRILDAQNLRKFYKQGGKTLEAVCGVTLSLDPGEVLAFLGPNGAGKTTTIKMIAGLLEPDAGEVQILGINPHRRPIALREVGAVLEGSRNLYWRLTPMENLVYFGVLRGLTRRRAKVRAAELLAQFELGHKRNAAVQTLSRGMQQKVAIAVALVHEPKLLLLDEPTLGLDVEATEAVKLQIRAIAATGRGVLLTTHQLEVAEALSDRVAIIRDGGLIAEASTKELIREFSGTSYRISLEGPLSEEQRSKLRELDVTFDEPQVYVQGEGLLYGVIDVLRPVPIGQIKKDEADLTAVFLKLVGKR